MNPALKRTTLVLLVLALLEVTVIGGLLFTGYKSAVAVQEMPKMVVSDTIYVPPVEAEEIVEETIDSETEAVWEELPCDCEVDEYDDPSPVTDSSGVVNANEDESWISAGDFQVSGVHQDSSGWHYTYYSEKVLPGGGLNIPGRHVDDEGYVVDGDGNLCVASDDLAYGTVINVPFGSGTAVVYDCGGGSGNLDVYVSW